MKIVAASLCLAFFAAQIHAQTGPSEARVLSSTLRGAGPSTMNLGAMVELTVSSSGRFTDARILESSGNAAFDAEALRYVPASMSGRPAITADGKVRDDATLRLFYGNGKKTIASGTPPPSTPAPVKTEAETAIEEGARILRMRCKDFLWEYDLMLSLHAQVTREEMPRTAIAVYGAMKSQPPDIKKLNRYASKALKKAAESCRPQPEAMFVKDALAPALDQLTN